MLKEQLSRTAIHINLIRVATLTLLFSIWQFFATADFNFSVVIPTIAEISRAGVALLRSPDFFMHATVSGKQLLYGISLGAAVALPVGLVLALTPPLRRTLEPLVLYLGSIPKIVIYPIFVWFLGIGMESKVGMAAASAAFPMLVQTAGAGWAIKPIYRRVSLSVHTPRIRKFLHVYLPAMLPDIYTGIRLGVATGIIGTLMAETKAADRGIGFLAIQFYGNFRIADMYATLGIIFVVATVLAYPMDRLDRRIRIRRGAGRSTGVAL